MSTALAASGFPLGQGETLRRMARATNYNAWLLDRGRCHLGRRLLDVGAGVGTFTSELAPGREVLALEPDPAFVPLLRSRFANVPNVEVRDAEVADVDASSLPELFDSAICFNVLEHVPDDGSTLRRLCTLLKPSGKLLLLVPAHPALYGAIDDTVGHERRYGKRALGRLLNASGFEVESLSHVNPVGALGWFVSSRLLRREQIPAGPLGAFDRLVPLLKGLDRLRLPIGLSLWAVARRPA
jgi:SAM-dependent methyltransferase